MLSINGCAVIRSLACTHTETFPYLEVCVRERERKWDLPKRPFGQSDQSQDMKLSDQTNSVWENIYTNEHQDCTASSVNPFFMWMSRLCWPHLVFIHSWAQTFSPQIPVSFITGLFGLLSLWVTTCHIKLMMTWRCSSGVVGVKRGAGWKVKGRYRGLSKNEETGLH